MFASQGIATSSEAQSKDKETFYPPEQRLEVLPNDQLPEGSLLEISGPEARAQAARIVAENRHLPTAWIEQKLEPLPVEVLRSRINVDRVLFVNGGPDSMWALSSLLHSGQFPLLVYYAPYEDEKFLRRMRRFAHDTQSTVLLLRETPCFSWTIRVQLHAKNGQLKVLRWRSR